jgi:hypothetical protein
MHKHSGEGKFEVIPQVSREHEVARKLNGADSSSALAPDSSKASQA